MGYRVLQIITGPFEPKPVKSGELGVCRQRQTLAFFVRTASRRQESIKSKYFEINAEREMTIASGEMHSGGIT